MVLLEDALCLLLVHGLSYGEGQHISNSNRYGRRGRWCTDAEGNFLQLVNRCREQNSVRALAQQRAIRGVRVRCDGNDRRVRRNVVE
jgi:hypothetical protein